MKRKGLEALKHGQHASSLCFSSDLVRAVHARWRAAPSVTLVAICVSRVLLHGLQTGAPNGKF